MRRRDFIKVVACSAITWPLLARAQQPAMTRVGIVTIQPPTSPPYVVLSQRLRELGYVVGQNLSLDFVNPAGKLEATRGLFMNSFVERSTSFSQSISLPWQPWSRRRPAYL